MTDLTDACFAGVAGQLGLLRSGAVTSVALVQACLARIERLDARPDGVNAFRSVFAQRALAEAAAADARRAGGGTDGGDGEAAPLLGVPVAVKEDIDLAGSPTSVGSDAVTRVAAADAEAVARLRRAGAIVVGQTRSSELCLWPFTESVFAGVTRNPWSLAHSPGGSSGGAAAAVAAGMVAGALGSDGGGSIRLPAAATGLFGLKPARGRVSLAPHERVWTGLSVWGPITRSVVDAGLLLDVLAGPMPGDGHVAGPARSGFAAAAAAEPGRLRVALSWRGWPVGIARVDPQARRAVVDTGRLLVELGHRVQMRDPVSVDPLAVRSYAPRYARSAAEWADVVDEPGRLSAKTRATVAVGRRVGPGIVAAAVRYGDRVAARVNRLFDEFDVLVTPVWPAGPLRVGELTEGRGWLATMLGVQRCAAFTTRWNLAGNPAASVPAGFDRAGLPMAVQVVGRPDDECTVLSVAAQLERTRPWADHRPPTAG